MNTHEFYRNRIGGLNYCDLRLVVQLIVLKKTPVINEQTEAGKTTIADYHQPRCHNLRLLL